jgi:hypothetical protein
MKTRRSEGREVRDAKRGAFSLVEVLIAGVVFFVILMVFTMIFSVSTRAEGRDGRRTLALAMAAEVLEQVVEVHHLLGDLPTGERVISVQSPGSFTLMNAPGGELQLSGDVDRFVRHLEIRQIRIGQEDALVRPDRLYQILVRVTYPGPVGETREQVLTTTRARQVLSKTRLEKAPWL